MKSVFYVKLQHCLDVFQLVLHGFLGQPGFGPYLQMTQEEAQKLSLPMEALGGEPTGISDLPPLHAL